MIFYSADVIICLDACFTQKRRRNDHWGSTREVPLQHVDTVFLPEDDAKAMEDYVDHVELNNQLKPPVILLLVKMIPMNQECRSHHLCWMVAMSPLQLQMKRGPKPAPSSLMTLVLWHFCVDMIVFSGW